MDPSTWNSSTSRNCAPDLTVFNSVLLEMSPLMMMKMMMLLLLLSVLMAIFPGEAGLAGLLALRIMEVVVTTGAVRRAKLHSDRYHRQTNTQFSLHARCPSCRPTNSVEALKGKTTFYFQFLFNRSIRPQTTPGYARSLRGTTMRIFEDHHFSSLLVKSLTNF